MTKPHRYIQNQFVKISRGTLNGLPLLLGDEKSQLSDEIWGIFIRDARRFNIRLLALNVEPHGYEAIIFDPEMRRSEFFKSVNQCVSMKVKKNIDHSESVWSNKKPGNTPILDLVTLENEIFEVCIKPVKRGYVRDICEWTLPRIGPSDWQDAGESVDLIEEESTVEQSNLKAFSLSERAFPRGPSLFSEGAELAGKGRLKVDLIDRIASFQRDEKARRSRVLGAESCQNRESFMVDMDGNRKEYNSPSLPVLCGSDDRLTKAILCLKAYYIAYRQALLVFIESKDAVFPGGTLKMRTFFNTSFFRVPDDDVFHFVH